MASRVQLDRTRPLALRGCPIQGGRVRRRPCAPARRVGLATATALAGAVAGAIVRRVAVWPARWQPEAVAALEPYLGTDHIVEVWVGDAGTSRSGTLLEGHAYVADDGRVTVIYDRSRRPDVYPWPLLAGPVLRMTARIKGRKREVIYERPSWTPPKQ